MSFFGAEKMLALLNPKFKDSDHLFSVNYLVYLLI